LVLWLGLIYLRLCLLFLGPPGDCRLKLRRGESKRSDCQVPRGDGYLQSLYLPPQVALSARRNPVCYRPQFQTFSLQVTDETATPRTLCLFWVRSSAPVQLRHWGRKCVLVDQFSMHWTEKRCCRTANTLVARGMLAGLLALLAAQGRLRCARFAVSRVGREARPDGPRPGPARPTFAAAERRLTPLSRSPPEPSGECGKQWKMPNVSVLGSSGVRNLTRTS
jgi:hypothetical protein